MKHSHVTYIVLAGIGALVIVIICFFAFHDPSSRMQQIEIEQGARVGAQVIGDLAEGYPTAVPKWEGATVVSSDHVLRSGFDVYDLTLVTDDDYDEVVRGYLTALQKAGFSCKQSEIGSHMDSIEASTTVHSASFTFFRNELNRTGITASIRTHQE